MRKKKAEESIWIHPFDKNLIQTISLCYRSRLQITPKTSIWRNNLIKMHKGGYIRFGKRGKDMDEKLHKDDNEPIHFVELTDIGKRAVGRFTEEIGECPLRTRQLIIANA